MAGLNNITGRSLDGLAHIRQSIRDILTTRMGTRIMRRTYGSIVPELIDHPMNEATRLRLSAATIMAILRWEPRVQITAVTFGIDSQGKVTLELDGTRVDGPRADEQISIATTL